MTARRTGWWIGMLVVGLAVLIAAGALLLVTPRPAAEGWVAYSPLSDATYAPVPSRWPLLVEVVLVAAGAFLAGFAVASLRARPSPGR